MASSTLPIELVPALHCLAHDALNLPLLQQILDAVPDIVLILDENRQIVFSNRALNDLLDSAAPDGMLLGEALNCVNAFAPARGCGSTEFCSTCGAQNALVSSLRGVETVEECHIARRDGTILNLQAWATPLQLGDKRYSICAVKDISHEKRRRALERIFFHDVLNTAGLISGFADLLWEAAPGEVGMMREQIFRLSRKLVEEITAQRELASAENNDLPVYPAPISSIDFLHELAVFYTSHEVAKGREIQLAPTIQPVTFTSDPTLLRRVVGNMIKNALEAIQPSQTITLTCEVLGDAIEFRVHNPGYIPRRVQLQIFQRSFSTKATDRGLGTYSMKLLSERYLRGKVSFTSTRSSGTTFKARYPLVWDGG